MDREDTRQISMTNDDDQPATELEWSLVHGFDTHGSSTARRQYMTKSQRAYAALRRAIVTHTLPSGTPLDELTLLDCFPFGRTPLREALKQLSFEGLLFWPPRQAPMIRDISAHEMRYLYETRFIVEPEIATLAAENALPHDISRIRTICDRLVDASRRGQVYESVEIDYALHAAIARATQNRFLAEASDNLNLQSLRLWFRAQQGLGVSTIHTLHIDLVEAVSTGDAATARDLAVQHIDSSQSRQQLLVTGHANSQGSSHTA